MSWTVLVFSLSSLDVLEWGVVLLLLHLYVVWRSRDVVLPPLDEDDVLASLPHHVVHRVDLVALVLDNHLKEDKK